MTTVDAIRDEARDLVVALGGGRPIGDTYERMCWRAATRTGMPFARMWAYFYRRIKTPPAHEIDNLRARWKALSEDRSTSDLIATLQRQDRDIGYSGEDRRKAPRDL